MAKFTVTNNNDSGAGSLRQAIIDAGNAAGVDTIDLTSVSGTINLNSSLGNLNTGNDINFVDDGNTAISGQNAYQILNVYGANVTFSRLTLANGLARGGDGNGGGGGGLGAGGALFINAGNVTLNNVTFSGNRAVGGNANGNAGNGGAGGNSSGGTNGSWGGGAGGFNGGSGGGGGGGGRNGYDAGTGTGEAGGSGSYGGGFGVGGGGGGGGGGGQNNFFTSWSGGNGGVGGWTSFGGGGGGGGGAGGGGGGSGGQAGTGSGGAGGQAFGFGGNGGNGSNGSNRNGGGGGRGGGGAGLGGAIFVNSGANLTLLNSVFTSNSATGGTGANNGQGLGVNIFVRDGGTAQSIGTNYSDTYGTITGVSFPSPSYDYQGSIYRLSTAGTWHQAQVQAQSLGGNLVTINTQPEQDWLVTTFGGTERLWTGLTDEVTQGQFKWASGENSTYTNWYPGEPNGNNGQEDYVGMNYNAAGKWNDYSSTYAQRGIIENKFFEYNGSRYLLTGLGTWEQTQAQANSLGGHLVTVNNQAEQDWLVTTFGGTEPLWTGLTDKVTQGQFKWASGSVLIL